MKQTLHVEEYRDYARTPVGIIALPCGHLANMSRLIELLDLSRHIMLCNHGPPLKQRTSRLFS